MTRAAFLSGSFLRGVPAVRRFAGVVLLTVPLLGVPVGAVPLAAQAARPAAADSGLARLEREIGRLAALAGGTVGVAAVHLETGRAVYLNPRERFPMASSYKVAIAVQLLTRVDRGEVRLDSLIPLDAGDLHPGSGTLTDLFDDPGVILSVRNLLELMLLISDNSATDLMLEAAGGAEAVTRRVQELGVEGLRVDRPTVQLIADWAGVRGLPLAGEVSKERWRELAQGVSEAEREAAAAAFNADPRDTSTPEAMARLLEVIWRGQALSPENTALLLDIMERCQTGRNRIKGMLPPGIAVQHKTGTIGGTTNDVGIIALPDGAGHVIAVVLVKESKNDVEERERAIAQIARAIYDYFLFNPGS